MKCNDCVEMLSAYIDDMLNQAERQLVEQHLEICSACQEEYDILVQMQYAMRHIDRIELPASFHEEMMTKVHEEAGTKTSKIVSMSKKRIVSYLSVVAAALIIVWIGNGEQDEAVRNSPMAIQEEYTGIAIQKTQKDRMPEKAMPRIEPEEKVASVGYGAPKEERNVAPMSIEPMVDHVSESLQEEIWKIQVSDTKATYEIIREIGKEKDYVMQETPYSECIIVFNTLEEKEIFKQYIEEKIGQNIVTEEVFETRTVKIVLNNEIET